MGAVKSRFKYNPKKRLITAVQFRKVDQVRAILAEPGVNVNARDKIGFTALFYAVYRGYDECVNLLIEAGADVNARRKSGGNALMMAARNGHHKCVDLLIKAGADVNLNNYELQKQQEFPNISDSTALISAALNRRHKCVDLLIKAGADVNATAFNGKTPLLVIFNYPDGMFRHVSELSELAREVKCVQLLILARAHVNRYCNDHNALEYYIAHKNSPNEELSKLLFAAGEILKGPFVCKNTRTVVPEYLKRTDLKLCLKHMCRETIRKHLLDLDPHTNLFGRIPQLGLPSLLTEYLLYNVSLDTECEDDYCW